LRWQALMANTRGLGRWMLGCFGVLGLVGAGCTTAKGTGGSGAAATGGGGSGVEPAGGANAGGAPLNGGGGQSSSSDGAGGVGGTSAGDNLDGTVWYVRKDGGDRTQCNGLADKAYPGSGDHKPCAFSDVRYLWTDGTYGNKVWVIEGGDAVVVRDGPWRVGYNGPNASDSFGNDPGNPFGAGPPAIPSGTAAHPTRFFGENWASCTKKTQLFGGYGVGVVLPLNGSSNVHVECLELTDHAQCSRVGSPALPSYCSSNYPLDDYAGNGMTTDDKTSDVLLKNLDIHGFTANGVLGPIGGPIQIEHVRIGFNAAAGWDFDDGNGTPNGPGSKITATDFTVEWSGCNEEYPIVHSTSAISCYDQDSAGYGDGIGTPDTQLDFTCDNCTFRYNTQDGLDLLHISGSSIQVTNSSSYGNMGQQWKLGAMQSIVFENNLTLHDCNRLSQPFGDAPATFNQNLSLFCRAAGDCIAMSWLPESTVRFDFNTFVTYGSTTFDLSCAGGCPTGSTFENNIVYGYASPFDGQNPGVFYAENPGAMFAKTGHNLYFHTRTCPTDVDPTAKCVDPELKSTPAFADEASLDAVDMRLRAGSPAVGGGVKIPGITTDRDGHARPVPPAIGAYEP
jgi:hypothetical protein